MNKLNKFGMPCLALAAVLLLALARPSVAQGPPIGPNGPSKIIPQANCSQYPIKITVAGAYILMGNLNLAATRCDKSAINVDVDNVDIDLNGFSIIGPCEVITCYTSYGGASDGHHGIDATDHDNPRNSGHNATTVKNGTVRSMGDDGVHLGNDGIIQRVRAISNQGEGIQCGEGCLVSDVLANGNGGDGLEVDDDALVKDVVSQGNGGHGIHCDSSARVSVRGSVFTANSSGSGLASCNNTGGNIP